MGEWVIGGLARPSSPDVVSFSRDHHSATRHCVSNWKEKSNEPNQHGRRKAAAAAAATTQSTRFKETRERYQSTRTRDGKGTLATMDAHEEQLSPRGRDGLDEWTLVDQEAEGMARVVEGTSSTADLEEQNRQGEETRRTSDEISADGEPAIPPGYLQIRVRVGEQVRPAYFKATQHVDDFTTKFFGEELAEGKRIRLIYMGMLLIQDRTMGEYGIEENGVIHVVINDSPPQPHPEASQVVELKGLANPANTLLISTGFILYGLWTLFYHFPHLFSWKAIVLLALLSVVHISATLSRLTT